jgi:hypothetical protein
MMKLAENVGGLLSGLSHLSSNVAAGSSTSPGTAASLSLSRCDQAFRHIADVEFLTPHRLVCAHVMFCGRTELADEYLSFGDSEEEVVAWGHWLREELEAAVAHRARRDAELE